MKLCLFYSFKSRFLCSFLQSLNKNSDWEKELNLGEFVLENDEGKCWLNLATQFELLDCLLILLIFLASQRYHELLCL